MQMTINAMMMNIEMAPATAPPMAAPRALPLSPPLLVLADADALLELSEPPRMGDIRPPEEDPASVMVEDTTLSVVLAWS